MAVTKKIMELLAQESKLNANQIVAKTGERETCIKTTLYNLSKQGKIVREKMAFEGTVRVGPKNIYIYSLPCAPTPP